MISYSGSKATLSPSAADAGKRIKVYLDRDYFEVQNLNGDTATHVGFEGEACILPAVNATSFASWSATVSAGTSKNPSSSRVGTTFSASLSAKATAGQKVAYQWLRNGQSIKGATKSTYKLGVSDYRQKIGVKITRSASGYQTSTVLSEPVQVSATTSKAGKVSVSGSKAPGKKLTAKTSLWAKDSKFSYHWYKNGKAIKKATKSDYTVAKVDRGAKICVKVTAKRTAYDTATRTSSPVTISKR